MLIANDHLSKNKQSKKHIGLFAVVQAKNNGTAQYQGDLVRKMDSIRRAYLYKE